MIEARPSESRAKIQANIYSLSSFEQYDSAFCGLSTELHNSKLYFGLCTHKENCSAGVFSFDVRTKQTNFHFGINEVVRTQNGHALQSKIHTKLFMGNDEKFYFGTHFAYPNYMPQDLKYSGGHIISFDPITRKASSQGILAKGEGIVTLVIDDARMHCYALTAPSFDFIHYDMVNRVMLYSTQIAKTGSICRSLGLDSAGMVYGSCEDYQVFKYNPEKRQLAFLKTNFESISVKTREWVSPYKLLANKVGRSLWRCIEYDTENNAFYGINASTCQVFEFDIDSCKFRIIGDTIDSEYDRAYPTLTLTKFGNTFYYSPSNGKFDYRISEDIRSTCSLFSYNSVSKKLMNHGLVLGRNNELIYGAAGASFLDNGYLYLIGAVSTENIEYNEILPWGNTDNYTLAIIEIDSSTLI